MWAPSLQSHPPAQLLQTAEVANPADVKTQTEFRQKTSRGHGQRVPGLLTFDQCLTQPPGMTHLDCARKARGNSREKKNTRSSPVSPLFNRVWSKKGMTLCPANNHHRQQLQYDDDDNKSSRQRLDTTETAWQQCQHTIQRQRQRQRTCPCTKIRASARAAPSVLPPSADTPPSSAPAAPIRRALGAKTVRAVLVAAGAAGASAVRN